MATVQVQHSQILSRNSKFKKTALSLSDIYKVKPQFIKKVEKSSNQNDFFDLTSSGNIPAQYNPKNIFGENHTIKDNEMDELKPYQICGVSLYNEEKKRRYQSQANTVPEQVQITQNKRPYTAKNNNMVKKARQQNFISIKQDDLEHEIEVVLHHVKKAEKSKEIINNRIMNYMTLGDQLYATKQGRIIDKYEKRENDWKQRVIKSANQCGRNLENSVYTNAEQFRQKVEQREILESVQDELEKHGEYLWYRKLREDEPSLDLNEKVSSKCQNSYIEIVIPRNGNTSSNTKQFKTDCFKKKLVERSVQVQKLEIPEIEQIQQIQLQGESVLKKEVNCLLKILKNQNQKPNQLTFGKLKQQNEPEANEEILSVNWNKKDLRRIGALQVSKMNFQY